MISSWLHIHAGRYAAFVWPAYGLSVLVVLAMLVQTLVESRRWRKAAERVPAAPQRPTPAPGGLERRSTVAAKARPEPAQERGAAP